MFRKNRIPRTAYIPKGCGQQGRHPEAAHAASEIEEYKPDPLWWVGDILWSLGLTAAVLFVLVVVGLVP